MNLFVWQPSGHGELSWFVMANDLVEAVKLVNDEIARRMALPDSNQEQINEHDVRRWGTHYYTLTIAGRGHVISHAND